MTNMLPQVEVATRLLHTAPVLIFLSSLLNMLRPTRNRTWSSIALGLAINWFRATPQPDYYISPLFFVETGTTILRPQLYTRWTLWSTNAYMRPRSQLRIPLHIYRAEVRFTVPRTQGMRETLSQFSSPTIFSADKAIWGGSTFGFTRE